MSQLSHLDVISEVLDPQIEPRVSECEYTVQDSTRNIKNKPMTDNERLKPRDGRGKKILLKFWTRVI